MRLQCFWDENQAFGQLGRPIWAVQSIPGQVNYAWLPLLHSHATTWACWHGRPSTELHGSPCPPHARPRDRHRAPTSLWRVASLVGIPAHVVTRAHGGETPMPCGRVRFGGVATCSPVHQHRLRHGAHLARSVSCALTHVVTRGVSASRHMAAWDRLHGTVHIPNVDFFSICKINIFLFWVPNIANNISISVSSMSSSQWCTPIHPLIYFYLVKN
jgi:hypothetical protein